MTTTTFNIQGMTCGGCVNSVRRALSGLPGVGQTDVSLEEGQATVEYDPALVSPEQLKSAVVDAGYDVKA